MGLNPESEIRGTDTFSSRGLSGEHFEPKQEYEFPNDTDERIETILSGIGNGAQKSVIFLNASSQRDIPVGYSGLKNSFMAATDGSWDIHPTTIRGLIQDSIVPTGMVNKENNGGISINEDGREYGEPLAKFMIRLAGTSNFSLAEVFSETHKTPEAKHRNPYTIFRLLELLPNSTEEEKSANELAKEIGVSLPPIGRRLKELQKLGLATYDSVDNELPEGKFGYTVERDFDDETPRSIRGLVTQFVSQAIRELQEENPEGFLDIDSIHTKAIELGAQAKTREVTGLILAGLANEGYIKSGNYETTGMLSRSRLTQDGEKLVENFIRPIRIALTDTVEGKNLRDTWREIPWQHYSPRAIQMHREKPGKAQDLPAAELDAAILDIIAQRPEVRSGEINTMLGRKNVNVNLLRLLAQGKIERIRKGKATLWRTTSSHEKLQETG